MEPSLLFCPESWDPKYFLFTSQAPHLLYYSHFTAIITSLLFGFFVFLKNRSLLSARILFFVSILFSLWAIADIVTWVNGDSRIIMFFWALMNLIEPVIFVCLLYFSYVFVNKKDVQIVWKIVVSLLLLPVIVLISSKINLTGFDLVNCEAVQGNMIKYIYFLDILFSFWIATFLIKSFIGANREFRKQIYLLAIGIILFLLAFSWANIIGNITVNWEITQYGLFGMPIFMGFLAYLIVQYKAFNIKLIGAQALVVALVILVGSQFFFAQGTTALVLICVTLALSSGFGYVLIQSVKNEVKRKEELQIMADKLAQANDELRKLDNAKTEFISVASHQLRTPVTAIKGFTSLIMEGSYGEVNEKVHGALERIYVSVERLVNLIEDLLNVSRIESGRMTFTFENSSIGKLLKELYDNFIIVAKNKKFYLDLKMPKDPIPDIKMDYQKIRELASNFIDNALKYTERGGVTVSAEIRDDGVVIDENGFVVPDKKSPYGKVVRITVSDTGIGIPKEEIPYLFRKFSRGKDVSRLHVGGTGLGLYVGKAIADAHHGQTWVESDGAGKGSRFMIEIPLEQQA